MDGWMDGWMDEWMNGWMDGWMDKWLVGLMDKWMDGWMVTKTNIVGMPPTGLQEIFSPAIVRNDKYKSKEFSTS